jgi:non-lysosomal glucosylceramidase
LAVAAAETKGARVTVTSGIFSRAAAANHWRAFELRGECVSETGVDSVKHRVDVPSNATLAYSAVCVSFLLPPGASREVVFSVAWDFPVASFDDDAAARAEKNGADAFATAFVKRYARYHPHGGEDVPLGAAAPALAALALARASEWEDAVRAWQKPYVDSAKPRTEKKSNADDDADATLIRRPPWFVSALFNELHHLVDAGTVWGRPLGVAGLDGVADSFFVKKFPSLSESEYVSSFAPRATATAFDDFDEGEDGEGGDAFDVAGNGGVWGGSLGRFGFAQNRDAPVYNSLPAYFFGSWGIAKFWPGIDLSVVADLASAVRFEDDAERDTKWAADRVAAQAGDEEDATTTTSQKNAGSVSVARKRRKVRGAAPHDLGDTRDGSLFGRGPLRDSVNAHDVSDVNAWLDLAPMLSLLVARAHVLRLEEDEDDVLFSEEASDARAASARRG